MGRYALSIVHPGLGLTRVVRPRIRLMTRLVARGFLTPGRWIRVADMRVPPYITKADIYVSLLFLQDRGLAECRVTRSGLEFRLRYATDNH